MAARGLSRRDFLALAGGALAAGTLPGQAFAATPTGTRLHGLSAFGDLKYPKGFERLDYVNPGAPKGGTFNFQPPNWLYNQNTQTYNTLNSFVPTGDAPPRMELCFDSLMTPVLDEPDAFYGLIAESVVLSADRNSFDFALRPEARFHDGTPLTADDVAFTFNLFKSDGHPNLLLPLTEMVSAEAPDPQTFRLTFSGRQSARTVQAVIIFPIVSKRYFTENPFGSAGLEAPLGSGPYRVGRISAGRSIEFDRVEDYWARDLPINRGLYNFDRIRIEFYRERQAAFEAFKKGDIHFRQEFTSRTWATDYDFPALTAGKVVKREFPGEHRPSMQAVAVNQRRERFRDARVRQAIGMCFDFEWTNRNLFYDAYTRSQSCFERSDYKAVGLPSPEELALLEPLRGKIPDEAFGEAVIQAVTDGSGRDRKVLGAASKLLDQAGWKRSGAFRVNDRNERLTVEILIDQETFARVFGPWTEIMKSIGIDASIRLVDAAQHQARQASFDFDLISMALSFSATPTRDEIDGLFHSRAASLPGSRNFPGTADPSVDALIDAVGAAGDRQGLITAMRALDRVLRARRDWIPNWYSANHRVAFWHMFGYQEPKPDYGFPVEEMWWFDKEKAAAIGKG
ncbi:MAG: extracellular solute-binding protein [Alphaproteobacteria bacterium]|nr:extracellular solute-binding protein [Alphaproteobacteria bacterium]MBU0803750.1 extracellular solute-binding protein [Alphaproteobacteria bacterium]MBU0872953.1 extracellular solute-binding protein [Alphaproteobacteria bacterium]MBU1402677.1 extracellular solute-binding protein [Alphaproteobacteria bacterium]MBU1593319.1 extracellular solute-binding protein [Alphaproteobacteria bacterium]